MATGRQYQLTRKRLMLGLCCISTTAVLSCLSLLAAIGPALFIEHGVVDILAALAMVSMFGVVCVLIWMHRE